MNLKQAEPSANRVSDVSLSEVDHEVLRSIRNIRYGSVEITIHDSRVVQIERKEKRRFERSNRASLTGNTEQ
jgi:hypothetical protein